ncbi:hypothetical protein [Spirillospora sp. NPDC047279]|uniref:hypothetical protein n=1 Tax=Spirillospora sp. NPDC047279 TaxID=3155478 RepID=UPI0033D85FD7
MTERSRGAPDPAEPSVTDAAPAPGNVTQAGDLNAVRRTDATFDALAPRRAALSSAAEAAADDITAAGAALPPGMAADPAVQLLRALVADVNAGAAPGLDLGEQAAGDSLDQDAPCGGQDDAEVAAGAGAGVGTGFDAGITAGVTAGVTADAGVEAASCGARRRAPRTILALGVAGVVLASTGVAAAGGGLGADRPSSAPVKPGVSGETHQAEADDTKSGGPEPSGSPAPRKAAPAPGRPAVRDPAPDPIRQLEDLKDRLDGLLPTSRPPRQGRPPTTWPAQRPESGDDGQAEAQRRIDEIRRQAQSRIDRYRPDR